MLDLRLVIEILEDEQWSISKIKLSDAMRGFSENSSFATCNQIFLEIKLNVPCIESQIWCKNADPGFIRITWIVFSFKPNVINSICNKINKIQ